MLIKKAVFPVAGLGARFLPATKANPKEMLPIVDKPLIQYAVEEAVAIGIEELIFVTSSSKRAIEDHFDSHYELESELLKRGNMDLLEVVQSILPEGVSCAYIRQRHPVGLGNAVLCAKNLVKDEPFAVLLADDLIDGTAQSCLKQMLAVYQHYRNSVVAVQRVHPNDVSKYGIVDISPESERLGKMRGIVEKPLTAHAASNLGVVGRYILTPAIFPLLETTAADQNGEVQLTDALSTLLLQEAVYAYEFQGKRYDCGSKLGYLEATIAYALKHPELAEDFKPILSAYAGIYD